MFPNSYFPNRYFPDRYFPSLGKSSDGYATGTLTLTPVLTATMSHHTPLTGTILLPPDEDET